MYFDLTGLADLAGLESLEFIGGCLGFGINTYLKSLEGLRNLRSVGRDRADFNTTKFVKHDWMAAEGGVEGIYYEQLGAGTGRVSERMCQQTGGGSLLLPDTGTGGGGPGLGLGLASLAEVDGKVLERCAAGSRFVLDMTTRKYQAGGMGGQFQQRLLTIDMARRSARCVPCESGYTVSVPEGAKGHLLDTCTKVAGCPVGTKPGLHATSEHGAAPRGFAGALNGSAAGTCAVCAACNRWERPRARSTALGGDAGATARGVAQTADSAAAMDADRTAGGAARQGGEPTLQPGRCEAHIDVCIKSGTADEACEAVSTAHGACTPLITWTDYFAEQEHGVQGVASGKSGDSFRVGMCLEFARRP